MWIEFVRPERLILAPILILACVLLARRSLSLGGLRSSPAAWIAVAIRCLVVAIVVAALAEPERVDRAREMTSIVIRDMSDSIPPAAQRTFDEVLARSLGRRRASDALGVISAARESMVQQLPTPSSQPPGTGFIGPTSGTDLAQALQLAAGIAPGDSGLRVLLATDGNQTRGDVASAARALKAKGIVVDTLAMPTSTEDALIVEEFSTPPWARPNAPVNAKIVLRAARDGEATVSIRLNGDPIDLAPDEPALSIHIPVQAGLNSFVIPVTVTDAGTQRFEAVVDSGGQTTATDSLTFVQSRGRVLMLADDPAAAAPLAEAIRDAEVTVEIRAGVDAPSTPPEWAAYDAIFLVDQPASQFSIAQQRALRAAIEDAGVGMIMVGGPRGFGAGGWIGSPLAEALPIDPEPPQKRELPMGALAIVIDQSGSMQAPVTGTNATQQQLANEAAILAVKSLRRLDQVAVIAFSDGFEIPVPITPVSDPASIETRIRAIGPGGGTNLFPAIDAAAKQLDKSPAGVKHMVILTDGQTLGEPAEGIRLVRSLADRGVTVTTIGIGDAANGGLLERLAVSGRGRFHAVKANGSLATLPQIFIDEARVVSRPMIWEGAPFTPSLETPTDSIRAFTGSIPPIRGYIIAADRGGLSTVMLRGRENDPILAQWQRGLGRVTAFTSDGLTRWTPAWVSWPAYQAFWRQQLAWALRSPSDPNAKLRIVSHPDHALATLELIADDGSRVNPSRVEARHLNAEGVSTPVQLRQSGPGVFQALIERPESAPPGAGILTYRYDVSTPTGFASRTVRGAVPAPPNLERRFRGTDSLLLNQVAGVTGGRTYLLAPQAIDLWDRENVTLPTSRLPIWPAVAALGIGLFIADVAARRLTVRFSAASAAVMALLRPRAEPKGRTLDNLTQARDRARDATAKRSESPGPERHSSEPANAAATFDSLLAEHAAHAAPTDIPPEPKGKESQPPAPAASTTPGQTLSQLRDIKRKLRDRR